MTLLGRMKATTWIVCSCATLLFTVSTSADICLLKEASVSQIRGQVKHLQEALGDIPVQVWKSDRKGNKLALVAEGNTNSSGYFSFTKIPSGWYRLNFPLPGFDGDDFLIHLQGASLLRWFPSNSLQVGLGLGSIHCPATYLEAKREKTGERK